MSLVKAKSVPANMREFLSGTVRSEERHPPRQDPASCSHRHTAHRGSNGHTKKTYCVDCGTYIDSVPRDIYNESSRASSNRDKELANRVLKDTTITKRQHETSMMLEQVSCLSDGDCEQSASAIFQLFPGLR